MYQLVQQSRKQNDPVDVVGRFPDDFGKTMFNLIGRSERRYHGFALLFSCVSYREPSALQTQRCYTHLGEFPPCLHFIGKSVLRTSSTARCAPLARFRARVAPCVRRRCSSRGSRHAPERRPFGNGPHGRGTARYVGEPVGSVVWLGGGRIYLRSREVQHKPHSRWSACNVRRPLLAGAIY